MIVIFLWLVMVIMEKGNRLRINLLAPNLAASPLTGTRGGFGLLSSLTACSKMSISFSPKPGDSSSYQAAASINSALASLLTSTFKTTPLNELAPEQRPHPHLSIQPYRIRDL